ncbi:MAG: hypothetical protein ABEK16_05700 [Candidatus Nanohalobium sp.]
MVQHLENDKRGDIESIFKELRGKGVEVEGRGHKLIYEGKQSK